MYTYITSTMYTYIRFAYQPELKGCALERWIKIIAATSEYNSREWKQWCL